MLCVSMVHHCAPLGPRCQPFCCWQGGPGLNGCCRESGGYGFARACRLSAFATSTVAFERRAGGMFCSVEARYIRIASRTTTEMPSPRAFAKASNSSCVVASRRTLIAADLTIGSVKRGPNGAQSQMAQFWIDMADHSGAHWQPMAHTRKHKPAIRRPMEKSIKVRLPLEHRVALERLAVSTRLNISYLVRDAVRQLIERQPARNGRAA